MATKINYNNKVPFQTREDIPDENKVNAEDMNEIKTAVNANADELDAAKEDIESLQGGQDAASTEITSLKNRVSTLETDNTTNKSNISNLQNNKVDKIEGKGLSTNDYTTKEKEKLASLENYNDTEIKEDISNLEAGQTEQDKQIDMLINALPTETQENEYINLKGTIPVKFKEFVVGGNSKQETRSGKNMLAVINASITSNGVTITNNGDGSLTLNGTATANIYYNLNADNNSKKYFKLINGNTYGILLKNSVNGLSFIARSETKNYALLSLTSGEERTMTYNYETDEQCFAYIQVNSGTVLNNVTVYPMLVEGTEIGDWEQYGAMPSPEYPSEIQNVEGDVNVTVANKEKTEQQTVTFPLAEGQRLMLSDYLASDGIHHVRKQMELDGTEDWALALTNTDTLTFQIVNNNLPVKIPNDNDEIVMISNYFKGFSRNQFNNDKETESISPNISNGSKAIIITINKTTAENLNDFKSWLAAQKQAATPVIIEYELAEEEVEAYTEEQQEAYNQLINLKAYEEETNVYSTNSTSPIFKVTAVKDINSVITQLNTVLLERS